MNRPALSVGALLVRQQRKRADMEATEASSNYLIGIYIIYGALAFALVVWLAQTLFRNGAVFLRDVFAEHVGMAEAVNRLMVTGFYMLNLGYAVILLRSNRPSSGLAAVELLISKLGTLLLTLGVL